MPNIRIVVLLLYMTKPGSITGDESDLDRVLAALIGETRFSITTVESITFLVEDKEQGDFSFIRNDVPTSIAESSFSPQIGKYCQEGVLMVQRGELTGLHRIVEMSQNEHCLWLLNDDSVRSSLNVSKLNLNSQVYTYELGREAVVIREVYSVKAKVEFRNEVFRRSRSNAAEKWSIRNFWERRSDLKGVELRHVMLDWRGYGVKRVDPETGAVSRKGLAIDVIDALERLMNFKVVYYEPDDCQWGVKTDADNVTWTGIIEELRVGRADFSTLLTIIKERSEAIDFTAQVHGDDMVIIMNALKRVEVNWHAYLHLFRRDTWFYLILVIILLVCGYAVIGHDVSVLQALALIWLLLAQRDYHNFPGGKRLKKSFKILYFTSCLFGFFIFTFYTAILTSLMTASIPEPPIKSFKDIYDKNLPLTIRGGAVYETYLKTSPKHSYMYKVFERSVENGVEFAVDTADVRRQIGQGMLYFGGRLSTGEIEGSVALNLEEHTKTFEGFGLPKNSEFGGLINHHLVNLRESGVLHQMIAVNILNRKPAEIAATPTAEEAIQLGYPNLLFPFLFLVAGILAALFVFGPLEKTIKVLKKL